MPTTRMGLPPITQDLWPVLRDRIATPTMGKILGGPGRVFIEGDFVGQPWAEAQPGGRAVIVPVQVLGGIPWEEGSPLKLRFLVRTDFNDIRATGYNPSREAERAQQEAARRLNHFEPGTVLVSSQVMALSQVWLDAAWQPRVLPDEDSGALFLSSSWFVDVASAAD